MPSTICPGYTRTEPVARVIEANPEAIENMIANDVPMGRLAEPEEIAQAVLWLSSDETGFVTGQALAQDGGKLI